jgi:ubiquinone/menaquinone biosynthesis C-methylase UbiE
LKFDHFGLLAPIYERFIHPTISEELLDLLDLPVEGATLDAGGGTGRIAQFLVGDARNIFVADQSFEMLQEARKKVGLGPVCALTEALPFRSDSFGRILMVDALHHVENQQATANELWRILKPGGWLIIEEPDISTFSVKLVALAEKVALMRSHFLFPDQIARLFQGSDARVKVMTGGVATRIVVLKEVVGSRRQAEIENTAAL